MKISQIGFTDNDFLLIREVRKVVFFDEMGIPESEIFDNLDEESDHFIFIESLFKTKVRQVLFFVDFR